LQQNIAGFCLLIPVNRENGSVCQAESNFAPRFVAARTPTAATDSNLPQFFAQNPSKINRI
jgi:hypothetical protein